MGTKVDTQSPSLQLIPLEGYPMEDCPTGSYLQGYIFCVSRPGLLLCLAVDIFSVPSLVSATWLVPHQNASLGARLRTRMRIVRRSRGTDHSAFIHGTETESEMSGLLYVPVVRYGETTGATQ